MGKFKDITGNKFGRLTALYRLHNYHKKRTHWLCVCDCGNLTEVDITNLQSHNTTSCGCYNKQMIKESTIKHGKTNTRLYNIYNNMKARCYNKNNPRYKDYGERGITICDEWLNDFMSFYNWSMGNGYQDNLTIDRMDNNKGYSPSNCAYVSYTKQSRNRRFCKMITINNESHCLSEWCEILGLKYATVKKRLYTYNWSIEKALEVV